MRKNVLFVFLILICCITTKAQSQPFTFLTATNLENIGYPFEENYITLHIQGEELKMEYMDVIPREWNGETVLLLHGKNFCGAYWGQTAKDLSDKGFRVVIPDQIGFGKSSKPHSVQYTFQLLALNTKAVLDTLGIKNVIVLGHSMGGMLATRFTLMFPERVTKLILEDPIGLEDWKLYIPYRTVDEWYTGELTQNYDKIKNYQLTSYYHGEWKPEYEEWVKIFAGWTNNIDYPRLAWNSALMYDMIFTQPVCYEFQNIIVPTLIMIGLKDRTVIGKDRAPEDVKDKLGNYPVLGKKTHALMKNSELVEFEGVGHIPHVEAYHVFMPALLNFLNQ